LPRIAYRGFVLSQDSEIRASATESRRHAAAPRGRVAQNVFTRIFSLIDACSKVTLIYSGVGFTVLSLSLFLSLSFSLPANMKQSDRLETFKHEVKEYIPSRIKYI